MDQHQPPGSQIPPPSYGPPRPPAPAQVVHIVAKPGGFSRAIGIVLGLFAFAAVFVLGIILGVAGMFASGTVGTVVLEEPYRDALASKRIAIIPVMGIITPYEAQFVRAAVDHVLDDDSIEAVVLRVDSPGGEVAASDQIWYQTQRLKVAGVPVVASYGGYAASGGYYVSCGADFIMAEETTITGSIGVIAQFMTLEGLTEKVGIEPVTLVATGSPEKDTANNIFRTWNEEDRAKVVAMLDAAYDTFRRRVSDGRNHALSEPARLDELANGSIFTAEQAKSNGLVDGIGYLDDAIAKAESLGGIRAGAAAVVVLREPPSLFGGSVFVKERGIQSADLLNADRVRAMVNDLASPRMMYLMH